MECLKKYFDFSEKEHGLLKQYIELLKDWNTKINLISRKETDFCVRHILHSLAIAKYADFGNSKILDVGTGGGLPGIPLAILNPEAEFLLIDSIGKKISAVQDIINSLKLDNVRAEHIHSRNLRGSFDYITARAVKDFREFYKSVRHLLKKGKTGSVHNGIIYLKGGDFYGEIAQYKKNIQIIDIKDFFDEDFFETKKIIHYKA